MSGASDLAAALAADRQTIAEYASDPDNGQTLRMLLEERQGRWKPDVRAEIGRRHLAFLRQQAQREHPGMTRRGGSSRTRLRFRRALRSVRGSLRTSGRRAAGRFTPSSPPTWRAPETPAARAITSAGSGRSSGGSGSGSRRARSGSRSSWRNGSRSSGTRTGGGSSARIGRTREVLLRRRRRSWRWRVRRRCEGRGRIRSPQDEALRFRRSRAAEENALAYGILEERAKRARA